MPCYILSNSDQPKGIGMLRKQLIGLGRAIKKDRSFDIDDSISVATLIFFVCRRLRMALRGLIMSLRCGQIVYPVFVGRRVVVTNARKLRLSPGVTIGDYCRLDCLGREGIALGPGATLRRGVQIEVTSVLKGLGEGCRIGARVGLSEGTYIGAKGLVTIGDDTNLGPACKIIAESHGLADPTKPIREQPAVRKGIVIGSDCWLGTNVTVLDGCEIGDHAVVGAGAVVTHNVEPNTVVAGVPAEPIYKRGRQASN